MFIYIYGIHQAEIVTAKFIVDPYAIAALRLAFAMAFNCSIEDVHFSEE